jgi:predicted MarR family transcription regulator
MTYDLRRLRLAGLIQRIERTHRYVLTPDGVKVAVFYTKLHNRLLRPLLAADQP